jgi:hypothetical protein
LSAGRRKLSAVAGALLDSAGVGSIDMTPGRPGPDQEGQMASSGTPTKPTMAELPPTMTRPEAAPSAAQRHAEARPNSGISTSDLDRLHGITNRPVTVGKNR